MTKTYTLKHVLFALREEYQKIEKELENLQQYVTTTKNVDDYYFHIAGINNESIISLAIEKKKTLLEKILVLLKFDPFCKSYFDIKDNVKSSYGHGKNDLCYINDANELQEKINLIKETEHFNNIYLKPIICNKNRVCIETSYMRIAKENWPYYPHLEYFAKFDEISIGNEKKRITPDDIFEILNISVGSDKLNDYHNKVIENYEEKEIVIEDNFKKRHAILEIIEEPKKLILVPKKK